MSTISHWKRQFKSAIISSQSVFGDSGRRRGRASLPRSWPRLARVVLVADDHAGDVPVPVAQRRQDAPCRGGGHARDRALSRGGPLADDAVGRPQRVLRRAPPAARGGDRGNAARGDPAVRGARGQGRCAGSAGACGSWTTAPQPCRTSRSSRRRSRSRRARSPAAAFPTDQTSCGSSRCSAGAPAPCSMW